MNKGNGNGKGVPHPGRQSNKESGWYGSPLEKRLSEFLFEKCDNGCQGNCAMCESLWDKYITRRPRGIPLSPLQFYGLIGEFSKV